MLLLQVGKQVSQWINNPRDCISLILLLLFSLSSQPSLLALESMINSSAQDKRSKQFVPINVQTSQFLPLHKSRLL